MCCARRLFPHRSHSTIAFGSVVNLAALDACCACAMPGWERKCKTEWEKSFSTRSKSKENTATAVTLRKKRGVLTQRVPQHHLNRPLRVKISGNVPLIYTVAARGTWSTIKALLFSTPPQDLAGLPYPFAAGSKCPFNMSQGMDRSHQRRSLSPSWSYQHLPVRKGSDTE